MTPADIERENKAMKIIDLVVDEGMTITDAVKEVGIARATWYNWVGQGRVVHLLQAKHEEVRAKFPWNAQDGD